MNLCSGAGRRRNGRDGWYGVETRAFDRGVRLSPELCCPLIRRKRSGQALVASLACFLVVMIAGRMTVRAATIGDRSARGSRWVPLSIIGCAKALQDRGAHISAPREVVPPALLAELYAPWRFRGVAQLLKAAQPLAPRALLMSPTPAYVRPNISLMHLSCQSSALL